MKFTLDDYSFNFDLNKDQNIDNFIKEAKKIGKKYNINVQSDYEINYSFADNMQTIADAETDKLNDLNAMFDPLYKECEEDFDVNQQEIEEKYHLDEDGIQNKVTSFLQNLKNDFLKKKTQYTALYNNQKTQIETSFKTNSEMLTKQYERNKQVQELALKSETSKFENQVQIIDSKYLEELEIVHEREVIETQRLQAAYTKFSMKFLSAVHLKHLDRDMELLKEKFNNDRAILAANVEKQAQEAKDEHLAAMNQIKQGLQKIQAEYDMKLKQLENSKTQNLEALEKKHAENLRNLYNFVNSEKTRYASVINIEKDELQKNKELEINDLVSKHEVQKTQIEEQKKAQLEEIEEFFAEQKAEESTNDGEITGTIFASIDYEFQEKGKKLVGEYTEDLIDKFLDDLFAAGYIVSWDDGTLVDEEYAKEQNEEIVWEEDN